MEEKKPDAVMTLKQHLDDDRPGAALAAFEQLRQKTPNIIFYRLIRTWCN